MQLNPLEKRTRAQVLEALQDPTPASPTQASASADGAADATDLLRTPQGFSNSPTQLAGLVVPKPRRASADAGHLQGCIARLQSLPRAGSAEDLSQGGSDWPQQASAALSLTGDIVHRELLVMHLLELRLGPGTPEQDLHDASQLLLRANRHKRALLCNGAATIIQSGFPVSERAALLMQLDAMPTADLLAFVAYCRSEGILEAPPPEKMAKVRDAAAQFSDGARAFAPVGGEVHHTRVNRRLHQQIAALMRLTPALTPPQVKGICKDIRRTIDDIERATPKKAADRRKRKWHTRTMFNEARYALWGSFWSSDVYATFAANTETFCLGPEHGTVAVGTLAALVWRAIEAYPQLAMPGAPVDAKSVARDKAGLKLAFVRALASCVEDNRRVCYAGKAARIMTPLDGWLRLFEEAEAPEIPPPPAAGDLLSSIGAEALGGTDADDEPSLAAVEACVGRALAACERHYWHGNAAAERERFLQYLREYIDGFHEAFALKHSRLWQSYQQK